MADVYSYFQRACRRELKPFGDHTGERVAAEDGAVAVFSLRLHDGRIASVQYRCTTCCTLVGISEHLSELLTGMTPDQALSFDGQRLLELHPEIPAERQERAWLAAFAAHSAVHQLLKGASI